MVAETREKMTEMFESWSDNFRATVDAGRRSQESVFKAVSDMCRSQPEFDGVFARTERMAREFIPMVSKNFQIATDCIDSAVKANMDVCKAICDASAKAEDTDFYKKSRQMWDAMFGAMRTQVDAFGKAGGRTMENFTEFFRTACGETMPRTATKQAK